MTDINSGIKKRFILIQSSSAPYVTQDPVSSSNKINLTDFSGFGDRSIDVLQVGFNAVAAYQKPPTALDAKLQFGFPKALREFVNGVHPSSWDHNTEGYAFQIGRFDQNPGFPFVPYSLNDIFQDTDQNLPASPTIRSTAAPAINSITGIDEKKLEFIITPVYGIDGAATENNVPNAPEWMKLHGTNPAGGGWNDMVGKYFDNKTYVDLSFEMDWPIAYKDVDRNKAASVREMYVKINPSYNFYVKDYEEGLRSKGAPGQNEVGFPVYMLPNIYMFASEIEGNYVDASQSPFWKHITLNNKIRTTFQDITKTLASGQEEKIGELDKDQHFEQYGRVLKTESNIQQDLGSVGEFGKYRNLVFPRSNLNLLENHQGKEKLFPMHVEVEFTTDINTPVADFLRDTSLDSVLMKLLIEDTSLTGSPTGRWSMVNLPDSDAEDPRRIQLENQHYRDYPVWDFDVWIDQIAAGQGQHLQDIWTQLLADFNLGVFMGETTAEVRAATDSQYLLYAQLMMHVFKNNIKELVKNETRPFIDLLRNNQEETPQGGRSSKFAHSETLFYRLQKLTGESQSDGVVNWGTSITQFESGKQDIYFPNSSDIDTIKYIDTQVMPNTPYRYLVWAYQLVIGNEYTYSINKKIWKSDSETLINATNADASDYWRRRDGTG